MDIVGKVALYPPNGGKEPTYFLERHVSEKIAQGWTLPQEPETQPAPYGDYFFEDGSNK